MTAVLLFSLGINDFFPPNFESRAHRFVRILFCFRNVCTLKHGNSPPSFESDTRSRRVSAHTFFARKRLVRDFWTTKSSTRRTATTRRVELQSVRIHRLSVAGCNTKRRTRLDLRKTKKKQKTARRQKGNGLDRSYGMSPIPIVLQRLKLYTTKKRVEQCQNKRFSRAARDVTFSLK